MWVRFPSPAPKNRCDHVRFYFARNFFYILTFGVIIFLILAGNIFFTYQQKAANQNIILTRGQTESITSLFLKIINNNPKLNISKCLRLLSTIQMSNEIGAKELRNLIKVKSNDKYAQRLLSDLKNVKTDKDVQYSPFVMISKSLKEFKPVRLDDYKQYFDNVKNSKVL